MGLGDWIKANATTAGPMTREDMDAAFEAMKDYIPPPLHNCRLDGHVTLLMSTRCMRCGELLRDQLSVDENHIRYGEFF